MNIVWKKLRTETVVKDRWIDLRGNYYRMPDGMEVGPFYTYHKQDFAVVVATDTEGNYICVRQFRQGIEDVTTEFVAGGLEAFDGGDAKARALSAAKRELREEAGYESDEWKHLITMPANATISDNMVHIFAARNCRFAGEQELDVTEFIQVVKYSPEEIEELIRTGGFRQVIHMLAWYLSRE